MEDIFQQRSKNYKKPLPPLSTPGITPQATERGFVPSVKRGWEAGVTGLLRGGKPQQAPTDESFIEHMGSMLGEVVSDIPGMIPSGLAGEALGGPIGGVAGAFAGPTLLKQSLAEYRDYAAKGNDITFGEFLDRAGRVGKETGKSAIVGAATGAVSKVLPFLKAVPGVDKLLATKYGPAAATGALELGAMTGTHAALEGRLPEKQEVVDNALMLLGAKAASKGGEPIARAMGPVLEKGKELGTKILKASPEAISKPFTAMIDRRASQKKFVDMLHKHIGERNARTIESQFNWRDRLAEAEKDGKFTPENLQDMIYYRQKTGNLFKEGDSYEALNKRLPKHAKEFVDTVINKHFEDSLDEWNANPATKNITPREGLEDIYLPGLYEFDPPKFTKAYDEVSKKFNTKNPFSNKKTFMTFIQAFERAGLKPRYNNIIDLMKAYDATMTKSMMNSELIAKIREMEKRSGEKLIVRSTDRQYEDAKRNGFIQFDDPYLRRYVVTSKEGKPVWATTAGPVLVHPDFAPVFQGVFTKESYKQPYKALQGYDAAGDLLRGVHVKYSPFHYAALMEHGASTIGARKSIGALSKWSSDIDKLRNDKEFMKDAVRSGLVIHTPGGVRVEGLKKGGHIFEEYHPRLKVASWKEFTDKEIGRLTQEGKPPTADEIIQIKRDMADVVNNIFGGQNWELQRVFNDPKNLKLARRLIGYPDWTISAIKNAANAFSPGLKGTVSRKVWMRYGINYMLFQGAMNFLMSGWKNKDPRDPKKGIEFDPKKALAGLEIAKNDPSAWYKFPLPDVNFSVLGHTFNPGRDADNRRLYAHTGKQALELGRWVKHGFDEFFSKSNPLIQMIWKQVMGSTPYEEGVFPVQASKASGWKAWGGSEPWTKERFAYRAKELAESVLPYGIHSAISNGPAAYLATGGGALPVSKGMSKTSSIEYLKKAMRDNDFDEIMRIRKTLADNGYSQATINSAVREARNKIKKKK